MRKESETCESRLNELLINIHMFFPIAIATIAMIFSPPLFAAAEREVGRVVDVSGKVIDLTYRRMEETGSLKLFDPLFFKDEIVTGNFTKARLHLKPDPASQIDIFVYENSRLTLDQRVLKRGDIITSLTEGLLRVVTKGLRGSKRLLIRTPNGVIGVRGSACWISISKMIVSIVVEEGTIEFTPNEYVEKYLEGYQARTEALVYTTFFNREGAKVYETRHPEIVNQSIKDADAGEGFVVARTENGFIAVEEAADKELQAEVLGVGAPGVIVVPPPAPPPPEETWVERSLREEKRKEKEAIEAEREKIIKAYEKKWREAVGDPKRQEELFDEAWEKDQKLFARLYELEYGEPMPEREKGEDVKERIARIEDALKALDKIKRPSPEVLRERERLKGKLKKLEELATPGAGEPEAAKKREEKKVAEVKSRLREIDRFYEKVRERLKASFKEKTSVTGEGGWWEREGLRRGYEELFEREERRRAEEEKEMKKTGVKIIPMRRPASDFGAMGARQDGVMSFGNVYYSFAQLIETGFGKIKSFMKDFCEEYANPSCPPREGEEEKKK